MLIAFSAIIIGILLFAMVCLFERVEEAIEYDQYNTIRCKFRGHKWDQGIVIPYAGVEYRCKRKKCCGRFCSP